MRSLVAAAAALEAATLVAARGPYKWSRDRHVREWHPARETPGLAYMPLLGMLSPPPPAPTAPPVVQPRMLEIRATDNTCAYISGNADSSLYCSTGSACVYNSGNSHIGCCPETDVKCPVFTTCLDSTQSSLFTSNNGFTLLCASSEYPFCLKHVFGDDTYFGYTLMGCGRTAGSDLVFFSATTTTTSSSTSSTTSSSSSSTSTSSSSHSQTTTTPAPQSPTSSSDSGSSSPPIAPIVGGAVGGFAALGLIGLGAAFLMRRSRKPPPSSSPAPPQPPAPGPPPSQSILGPNGPQEMAQQHHYPQGYAAVPAADATAAAAAIKAHDPYNPSSYYDPDPHQQQRMSVPAVSPQASPPIQQPQNQGQVQWAMPAPQQHQQPYQVAQPQYAAPYQVAQPDGQPYQVGQPQQQHPSMGYQSGPVAGAYQAAELDARPETQLRELPS